MKYMEINNLETQLENTPQKFIEYAEENYDKQIETVTKEILKRNSPETPEADRMHILLLSGPSGSGKTTTALKIENILEQNGLETHTVSMDNYFLPDDEIAEVPLDENGNPDLESPYRLNIPLFKEHLQKINDCQEVLIPSFDFKTRTISRHTPLKRKENEVIVIEGIHALNPLVNGNLPAMRLYVSVRTRLKLYDLILHPRKIRLMRRLCRDKQFRGRSFNQISDMFKSVSKGEDLYISPYKKYADFEIDTFISYETCLYAEFILNSLKNEPDKDFLKRKTYLQIEPFLKILPKIPVELIPETSLVREFIGGSLFKY